LTVKRILLLIALVLALPLDRAAADGADSNWRATLHRELPLLGHRNWIVIVDSAYPLQNSSGIETVLAQESQLDVVKGVLDVLKDAKHVRGNVFLDAELPYIPEAEAKGIGAYRTGLDDLLKGQNPVSLPHEQIIKKLEEAGSSFHVLVIKTGLTLPYTSVFIQLDCGYWSADAERALREAMPKGP
jgi:hypothetical protein